MRTFVAAAGLLAGLALSAVILPAPAPAQELKIAVGAEPTSMDPLYHNLNPNLAIARHIFDQLAAQDEKQRLQPRLALSWKPIDDTTWEFKLRPGVKFHDGTPLTPEDIIFSIDRADKVPNSPSALSIYTKEIAEIAVVDPLTIHIKTHGPIRCSSRISRTSPSSRRRRRRARRPTISTRAWRRSAPGRSNSSNGCRATGSSSSATMITGARSRTGRR